MDLRVTLPDESEHRLRLRAPLVIEVSGPAMGRRAGSDIGITSSRIPITVKEEQKDVPTLRIVRAAFRGRPRASESPEAKRHRGQGNDLARAPGARVGSQEAGRDQE